MAWLFVPGLTESGLGFKSLTPNIERFVTSKGRLLPRRYWLALWKKAAWFRLLYGATLQPSTADAGVASWISSTLAYRVNPTALPDSKEDPTTTGTFGPTFSESSARSKPPWFSLKTSQICLPGFNQSGRNYRRWVIDLKRAYIRRRKSERPTPDNAFSSWRTPNATDGEGGTMEIRPDTEGHYKLRDDVGAWAKNLYPTPTKDAYGSSQNEGPVPHDRPSRGTPSLNSWARNWATPSTRDWKAGGFAGQLGPQVQGTTRSGPKSFGGPTDAPPQNRPRLNPEFVEWIMGLPIGWTGYGVSGTRLFLSSRRGHLRTLKESWR